MFDPDPQLNAILQNLVHPRLKLIDPALDRIMRLLDALGNPQNRLPPVVHIAGTNGKGSLVAYLRSILKAGGLRVHSYTSPHLVRFNERIRVNEQEITTGQLIPLLNRILALKDDYPSTFFEATTAAAFLAFCETPADIVILETGMGGRLDATNVLAKPAVTAITPIAMDHTEFLGETLEKIAAEKAGIIKPETVCVVGPQLPQAMKVIESTGKNLFRYGREWECEYRHEQHWTYRSSSREWRCSLPGLQGDHQIYNAATALAVIEQLKDFSISREVANQGLQQVSWPARLQKLDAGYWREKLPGEGWSLVLDGGHNPHAAKVIVDWARRQNKPVYLILGMLRNKDINGYLEPWKELLKTIHAVSIPDEADALAATEVTAAAQKEGFNSVACQDVENALELISKQPEGLVIIGGSLYLAGYILRKN